MAKMLFPVAEVPDFIELKSRYDRRYKRSMKWDSATGDFVRNGANQIVECDGMEAYAIWCFKVAQTERYRCRAYPSCIGVEIEKAMADSDTKTVESMMQRTITDALMVNPRTEYVGDFVFAGKGDDSHCTFIVKGLKWDKKIKISV